MPGCRDDRSDWSSETTVCSTLHALITISSDTDSGLTLDASTPAIRLVLEEPQPVGSTARTNTVAQIRLQPATTLWLN
jgi:hypothetical protein